MPYHSNNKRGRSRSRGGTGDYQNKNGNRNERNNNSVNTNSATPQPPVLKVESKLAAEAKPPVKKPIQQKSRLFVGNLASGTTEEDFKKLFSKYGELSEVFVHSDKGFAFVRMDTRANAETAKYELDGELINGRQLRVRYATSGAALSVKNLSPMVSNELLEQAFSQFGQVERAVVIVDDKGRSTCKGVVEFTRKGTAQKAIQQINDGCFLITASPRVVTVTMLEQEDSDDGLPERNMAKTPQFYSAREAPPRFAIPGTFEEQFSRRWKALDDLEREQRDQLERSLQSSREKLESEMENSVHEQQAMLMKQDLMRRQEELERLEDQRKRELERRHNLEMARMDAHNKEMIERQHRQEVLRAQIEGQAFKNEFGHPPPQVRGFGRSSPPGAPPMQQPPIDMMGHDLMGQGGLAPAPSRFDQRNEFSKLMSGGGGNNMGHNSAPPPGNGRGGFQGGQPHHGGGGNTYNHHRNAPPPSQQHNNNNQQPSQSHQQGRRNYPDMDFNDSNMKRRRF